MARKSISLTLLHSERPKLYAILAFLSAIGLRRPFHNKLSIFVFINSYVMISSSSLVLLLLLSS